MAVVLGGRRVEVPGVRTVSWLDDARVPRTPHVTPRRARVQLVVLHTTEGGAPAAADPGGYVPRDPSALPRYAATSAVSWDATVLPDGTVAWQNDPATGFTWHANQLNDRSVGIELQEGPAGHVTQAQVDALVPLVDFLTGYFGIQRQVPYVGGRPDPRLVPRLLADGGATVVGVVGHRNANPDKADPGDAPLAALRAAGYEGFDLVAGEDLAAWAARQRALGVPADGVPGPATAAALARRGHPGGVLVARGGAGVGAWLLVGAAAAGLAYAAWRLA